MSVTVSGLTKLYGTQKALDNITLEILPGGITGLLGPNGAGKSTLMKILACFIPPTSGSATVCGLDVMEQSIEVRRRVGYLPENNPLYLELYVPEFLRFTGGTYGMKKNLGARVAEMIALTGLSGEKHKKIGALSKGYRQRVGLAQALIHDPEVLILDEPTSGLDPNQLVDIRQLITEIGRTRTVLLSTHIMQEVEAICSRAVIIHKGRIVADDTTKNLHSRFSPRTVLRVEFSRAVDGKRLRQIQGATDAIPAMDEPGKTGGSATHWLLSSDPATDIREAVFRFAVEEEVPVISMNREEQRLEEVFQQLTRN